MSIVEIRLAKKKQKLYVFFVDFKAAFDCIDRNSLFYKLYNAGLSTKLIKVLKSWYSCTRTSVWDGAKVSDSFTTIMGLKQGCLLSPTLFALFVNDLQEVLGGGVSVGDVLINMLMYADDIVLLAESPEQLQVMINKLSEYCRLWNLSVNMEKSKVMIFSKGGGKKAKNEKWLYNGMEIDIVNKYKYLGITLTPKLSMKTHLTEKLAVAKFGINSVWKNFIMRKDVSSSNKYHLFKAVSRSVMCYGAQVWGYKSYDEVEKLLRYFIKKMFRLPDSSPNYMIMLETGLHQMFHFTAKLHFIYITKILQLPEKRFPRIIAEQVISRNISWFKEWHIFLQRNLLNVDLNTQHKDSWRKQMLQALEVDKCRCRDEYVARARQGTRHGLYKLLTYDTQNYFHDSNSIETIQCIFKSRGDLFHLNASIIAGERNPVCSLCNTGEREDNFHFFAKCPVLAEFRFLYFGQRALSESEFLTVLNGHNREGLCNFAKTCIQYRGTLLAEFNL